jgi:transposase InsO family protein
MPNGKPGDHPLTDILLHNRNIYSPMACALVREIAALVDEKTRRELGDLLLTKYNEYSKPDIAQLEAYLTDLQQFRQQYNEVRPHSSLGQLTPTEFKRQLMGTIS